MVLYTYSTIFEDQEGGGEERGLVVEREVEAPQPQDYSVSEISESFTIVQKGASLSINATANEDTDVEEDDEFDEYSEVTFEQPKAVAPVRNRKNTVYGVAPSLTNTPKAGHFHGSSNGKGLCHCAETYKNSREKRRRAVSTVVNTHQVRPTKVMVITFYSSTQRPYSQHPTTHRSHQRVGTS